MQVYRSNDKTNITTVTNITNKTTKKVQAQLIRTLQFIPNIFLASPLICLQDISDSEEHPFQEFNQLTMLSLVARKYKV